MTSSFVNGTGQVYRIRQRAKEGPPSSAPRTAPVGGVPVARAGHGPTSQGAAVPSFCQTTAPPPSPLPAASRTPTPPPPSASTPASADPPGLASSETGAGRGETGAGPGETGAAAPSGETGEVPPAPPVP